MLFFIRLILFLLIIFFLTSCAKEDEKKSLIKEKSQELQLIEAYNEGIKELEKGDAIYAAKKFNEVEIIYPQSIWAPRASLMAAYAFYSQSYYDDAIIELERFLDKYRKNSNRDYAYYLLGLCYYDLIVDETKDFRRIVDAEKNFKIVLRDYPNTEYAIDASFKLEVIREISASKEMYLARYYLDREKWIPARNRFRKVVTNYSDTIFIEEALHRLVELSYKVGLVEESKKYASLLGYNYQSSEWYERTYKVFNKDYRSLSKKKQKKKENKLLKKFKELLK